MAYLNSTCLPITQLRALTYCILVSILYVLSIYIGVPNLPRDFPSVVRARMRNAILYTIMVMLVINYDLYDPKTSNCPTFLELIGISSYRITAAALLPLLLTVILFLGPIVQYTMEGCNILSPYFWMDKDKMLTFRTLVIAPVTEEVVYRGCMFPLLHSAFGVSAIVICPLIFGLAHLHHFFEWFKDEDNFINFQIAIATLKNTILGVIIQALMTFVFGVYSTFLLWRTCNIISPIICHAFCNGMGPPPIQNISSTKGSSCIIATYIIGLVMFIFLLLPLTNMHSS